MHEGLTTLTGFPCLNIDIDSHAGDENFLDEFWARLVSAHDANFLIGASCGSGRKPVDDRELKGLGLMSQVQFREVGYTLFLACLFGIECHSAWRRSLDSAS
jgi:hypothetical protein